jgi:hypothetical protein
MANDDMANERALKLYELALSLLRVKGAVKLDGLASGLEYRGRLLNIEWRPDQGQLDIWSGRLCTTALPGLYNAARASQLTV